jgi:hypothetical protein
MYSMAAMIDRSSWANGIREGVFKDTVEERVQRDERIQRYTAQARSAERTAWAFVATCVLATLAVAWRTRHQIREWHWLSFFGLATLSGVTAVASRTGPHDPWAFALMALVLIPVGASLFDLRRGKLGSPGRLVTWTTLALSLILLVILAKEVAQVRDWV